MFKSKFLSKLSVMSLMCTALALLVSCNPEAFLDRSVDETHGAGLLGAEARVKNYGQNLEGFAAAIQNEIVTGQGTGNAFLGGSDAVDAVLASNALSGAMMNEMDAVYCDGSDVQLTWMDSRDADDNFFVKGLGRQAGERIVAGLSGRMDGAQIGVYDGISIQMADGSAQAVPSEVNCGSVAVDIPVGAPVMVFANIAAAAGQVDLAQRYEYRTEDCGVDGQGNPQSGSVLYRELKSGNEVLDSVLVSSNCSSDVTGQTDLALLGEALSRTDLTDGVNFAGGGSATGTAIEGALSDNLSDVECREIEQAPNTDTDNDGINDTYVAPDGATDQSYSTCAESIALAQTNYDFEETLTEEEDWNVFTTECGGASGSKNESINGEVATISYPAYSGEVTYRQKVYVGTLDDGTESETLQRVGKPEAIGINCYRPNTATVSCNAQRPADYGNGNTWTFKSGAGFDVERTETVTDFADATTTPPTPDAPNYGSWAATAVDCVWTESEVVGDEGCPANHVATVDGVRERDHNVTDFNGNTSPSAWTTTTPPTCEPIVTGACGSADGTSMASAPSSGLCSSGSASSVSGSGPWTWTCSGEHGGGDASCSAPVATISCPGDRIAYAHTVCTGMSCVDELRCTEPGICSGTTKQYYKGAAEGGGLHSQTPNHPDCTPSCSYGSESLGGDFDGWTGNYCGDARCGYNLPNCASADPATDPTCRSRVVFSGGSCSNTSRCEYYIKSSSCGGGGYTPTSGTDGQCGSADGVSTSSAPTSGLCSDGSASSVTEGGSTFTWTCSGSGSGSSDSCSAPILAVCSVSSLSPSSSCAGHTPSGGYVTTGGLSKAQCQAHCNNMATTHGITSGCCLYRPVPKSADKICSLYTSTPAGHTSPNWYAGICN